MPEKPVVITNNGLFRYVTIAVQIQQNLRFSVGLYRPVAVLRQLRYGRFSPRFYSIHRYLRLQKRGGQR